MFVGLWNLSWEPISKRDHETHDWEPIDKVHVDGFSIGNTLVMGQLLACCTSPSVCNHSFFVLKLLCSDLG